jgi:hypothetical protein
MRLDLNKEAGKLAKNFEEITGLRLSGDRTAHRYSSDKSEQELDEEYAEAQRLTTIEEIRHQANENKIARLEAEAKRRGYTNTMDFVCGDGLASTEYLEWDRTVTRSPIEEEYNRLQREHYDYNVTVYERKTGQKYVDPNAKF